MNDLTFGATLLACFAALIVDVALESTAAPAVAARTAAARTAVASAPPARPADQRDCIAVAQAPTAAH